MTSEYTLWRWVVALRHSAHVSPLRLCNTRLAGVAALKAHGMYVYTFSSDRTALACGLWQSESPHVPGDLTRERGHARVRLPSVVLVGTEKVDFSHWMCKDSACLGSKIDDDVFMMICEL